MRVTLAGHVVRTMDADCGWELWIVREFEEVELGTVRKWRHDSRRREDDEMPPGR